MTEEAEAYFKQARKALRTARLALSTDDADGCANRAYYAAFYAASAALQVVGEAPKTHRGTMNRFWTCFAKEGPLLSEQAQILRTAFRARQKADYDVFATTDMAGASDLLDDVEKFVELVEELVRGLST